MIIALLNWLIHDISNTYLALIHYIVMVCSESIISYMKPVFICPRYIIVNLSRLDFFSPPVLGLQVFQQLLIIRP